MSGEVEHAGAPMRADGAPQGEGRQTYVIFSALYLPHMGGVETYTANLARQLVARGHRVIVATSQLSRNHAVHETQPDGVEVLRFPCRALMGGRLPLPVHDAQHRALMQELADAHPTRVVVNTRFYGHSLDGAQFAREQGIPAIVVEHGSAHLSLGNAVADQVVQRYEHAVTERMKSFGYPFVGVSRKACAWLEHFGIEAAGVVPNAIDADAYAQAASARDFRNELGVQEDDLLVACVGRLVPEKGISAVLETARVLDAGQLEPTGEEHVARSAGVCSPSEFRSDSDSPVGCPTKRGLSERLSIPPTSGVRRIMFAVAGDGPLLEDVQAAGGNVAALGRLDVPDVAALLQAADVYLLPSRSEGFATTLLEACAMGAFPATTDVGGVDELGIGSVGGAILPDVSAASIAGALLAIADNRGECLRQAHALQQRVRVESSWDASAAALEEAFDGGAADGQSPAAGSEADGAPFEGDEKLDQLHRVLLMMMKDFAAICERENIGWIAHYGTAIGALRHGGFIPWDDDIDICMMRPDLEKFERAVQADPSGKYFIVNAHTHPNYPLTTTRFVLANTEFRDSALATMDFPSGIFLDLFPLDALADDEGAYKRQVIGAWFFNKLATAKLTANPYIAAKGMQAKLMSAAAKTARAVLNLPGIRTFDPNKVAYTFLKSHEGEHTRRAGYPCDTGPWGCIYEVDDLLPVRWVPFEDMLIPVPNKVEQQLTDYYGDWMTPPPGNERKGHYPDILDFGPYANM